MRSQAFVALPDMWLLTIRERHVFPAQLLRHLFQGSGQHCFVKKRLNKCICGRVFGAAIFDPETPQEPHYLTSFFTNIFSVMKKAIFLLPVLAFVSFLTFCTKTNVQEEATVAPENVAAADRNDCCFNVYSDNIHDITFCGTNLNSNNCLSCTGGIAKGVNVMVGDGSQICIPWNTRFYIRTASPGGSWILLAATSTGNPNPGWVYIPAGGCQGYYVNDACDLITF